jgi:hypothetical protein
VKTAKTVHDQKLERWGDRTEAHSTNPLPYSSDRAKKNKFKKEALSREKNIQAGRRGGRNINYPELVLFDNPCGLEHPKVFFTAGYFAVFP